MTRTLRRLAAVAVVGLLTAAAVGCTPPSGLPDSRQYNTGCGSFEVRVGQQGDTAYVAVRQFGFQIFEGPICGIVGLGLNVGPDSANVTHLGCSTTASPPCVTYSAGFVTGTWTQLSAVGQLQSALVVLHSNGDDTTRYIEAYP